MRMMGFNTDVPREWNRWWVAMWGVLSVGLLVSAFFLRFGTWALAAVIGFGVPEAVSLLKKDDALPPLTHTIRHFLPSWLAFSLIYFLVGTIGATWLGFQRPLHLGALFGLLGWLTDHFTVTYQEPDPHPFSRPARAETETARLTL